MVTESVAPQVRWKIYAALAGAAASMGTHQALRAGWHLVAGHEPPPDPEHPDVHWLEAATWAGLSAAIGALVRLAIMRKAATAWQQANGSLPPPLERE